MYRLHRETFYLAVDFLDRYLGISSNIPKNRLQLIGVTCLFIGAKLEEIYPPKLQEFAYVTGKPQLKIFFFVNKMLNVLPAVDCFFSVYHKVICEF